MVLPPWMPLSSSKAVFFVAPASQLISKRVHSSVVVTTDALYKVYTTLQVPAILLFACMCLLMFACMKWNSLSVVQVSLAM